MLRNALRKLTKKQNHRLTQAGGSLTNSFIYILLVSKNICDIV